MSYGVPGLAIVGASSAIGFAQEQITSPAVRGLSEIAVPPEMRQHSTTLEDAYVKAAFWLGAASRIAANQSTVSGLNLARQAQWYLSKGVAATATPGVTADPTVIGQTLRDAARALEGYTIPDIVGIRMLLLNLSVPALIEEKQDDEKKRKWIKWAGLAGAVLLAGGAVAWWRRR